jgi:hypothetical protein
MANHKIPAAATLLERLEGRAANGATVVLAVYRHVRAGAARPMFYVVGYQTTADGRIDRATRETRQFTGADAAERLEAEMGPARAMLAASVS